MEYAVVDSATDKSNQENLLMYNVVEEVTSYHQKVVGSFPPHPRETHRDGRFLMVKHYK